ncbi:UNVERIFIED_CONTAM: hypothetical protein FKN15_007311 [Acipenser sinensis]
MLPWVVISVGIFLLFGIVLLVIIIIFKCQRKKQKVDINTEANIIRVRPSAVSKPTINLTETSNANETCSVTLNCSVEYRDDVFIHWEETGINNTKSITDGSLLEYTPVPSTGDEESFTCYAENRVSKNSTIITKNKLTCRQPVEDSVKTTCDLVGETNHSITTEYDVVRPERMNQPTDLPTEITTIYATV